MDMQLHNGMAVASALVAILVLIAAIATMVLAVMALAKLKEKPIDEISRILWVWLILTLPIAGAIAFFIVSPGKMVKKVE